MTYNIPYFVAGDPDLNTTYEMMMEVQSYVKAIVLSFPFSDPMAGGEQIQKANVRALENMIHTMDIFMMLRQFKENSDCPIIIELYFNQIFTFGIERFFEEAKQASIKAIRVLDLPIEHENEILPYASLANVTILHSVSSLSEERLEKSIHLSKGAVICLDKQAYKHETMDLCFIQEVHNLDEEIFSEVVIYKEPLIDLMEVFGLDKRSRLAVKIQIKNLLL